MSRKVNDLPIAFESSRTPNSCSISSTIFSQSKESTSKSCSRFVARVGEYPSYFARSHSQISSASRLDIDGELLIACMVVGPLSHRPTIAPEIRPYLGTYRVRKPLCHY